MSDPFQTHSAFSWCELQTDDVEKAKTFYSEVIGWEMQEMEMPDGTYTVLRAGDRPVGGIMKNPQGVTGAHWATYVTVDDVDQRIKKAAGAGATVLVEPFDVPGVGRIAVIADPTGAAVSLIAYEPQED